MNTLRLFAAQNISIPSGTSWYLADLGEFRGKQALYTQQSPQRLKTLREHALIESAVSSSRIEGVSVDPSRVRDVLVAAKPLFRDRDEEEVRGYRDALERIHEGATNMSVSEATIRELHRLARGQIWDAGQYKEKDGDIILESSVERAGVCGFPGAGQGATTRNGCSIPRSCNAAMRPENSAIQPVAFSPSG